MNSQRLVKTMHAKWRRGYTRKEYLKSFSVTNWTKLRQAEKNRHTVQHCLGCQNKGTWNDAFPVRKAHRNSPPVRIGRIPSCGQEKSTQQTQVNTETPRAARKAAERKEARKFKKAVEQQRQQADVKSLMADRCSFVSLNRQRKRRSFETMDHAKERTQHTAKCRHTPKTVSFNGDALLADAQNTPEGDMINFTQLATSHIEGPNRGQIAKTYLMEHGFNVNLFSPKRKQHVRPRVLSFGCNVKVPVQPNTSELKRAVEEKVQHGEWLEGEECTGSVVIRYSTSNTGAVARTALEMKGRKLSLQDVRQRLLEEHETLGLMRETLGNLVDYCNLSREGCLAELDRIGEHTDETAPLTDLCHQLYCHQLYCHLMQVVQVIYDPAVHVTNDEYKAKHGTEVNVQSLVEAPYIRVFAMSGCSEAEQLSVIPDRLQDLHCSRIPIGRKKR